MPPIRLYQVFGDRKRLLHGNTSTVIFLDHMLPDPQMQQLAADLCQPATTFLCPGDSSRKFQVRWFAPDAEIGVCGHGAAAAISYLADQFNTSETFELHFAEGSMLGNRIESQSIQLELPAFELVEALEISEALQKGLGIPILSHFKTTNKNIVLVESEELVQEMKPNFEALRKDGHFGYIVTAPGNQEDFVSRTLVPHVGQLEDPATGSSHATLTPFWAEKLGKTQMNARQLSARGGSFHCSLKPGKCVLTGQYQLLMAGELNL